MHHPIWKVNLNLRGQKQSMPGNTPPSLWGLAWPVAQLSTRLRAKIRGRGVYFNLPPRPGSPMPSDSPKEISRSTGLSISRSKRLTESRGVHERSSPVTPAAY